MGVHKKNCNAGKAKMTILLYRFKWCASICVCMVYTRIYGFVLLLDILISNTDILKIIPKYNYFI